MFFYKIKSFIYKIKWFIQRGKRGYSDYDIFDISDWITQVIVPMLKQLKETKCGYPCDMTEEEWNSQLDKMIKCFMEISEDGCSMKNEYENKVLESFDIKDTNKDKTEECKELREKWLSREKEINNYKEKMKIEAFNLFSKYFWNLWT